MFCMLGGIFAFRWLSYSVAGRGVVKLSLRSASVLAHRLGREVETPQCIWFSRRNFWLKKAHGFAHQRRMDVNGNQR